MTDERVDVAPAAPPRPTPPRRLVGVPGDEGVRCPVCNYVIATVRPVPGSRLTVQCPNRRCPVWVVVIVPVVVE